jgi:orotidine 5'-phosphate decarboxylase subfamily 1
MHPQPLTYLQRSQLCSHTVSKQLLALMEQKKTNLCFNPDVKTAAHLLALADDAGPHICMLKTHVNILEDFDPTFATRLQKLAQQHQFFIFEDHKFSDIGAVVAEQYQGGLYKIVSWAHITNAHSIAGPGIIEGLKKVGLSQERALLMLAEMSSEGNLATDLYTQKTVAMARKHPDFVIGFIAMHKLCDDPTLIYLTPGVQKEVGQDALGQRYKTPHFVIKESQSDIIIVGRGIYGAKNPKQAAREMQELGWNAYLERLQQECASALLKVNQSYSK